MRFVGPKLTKVWTPRRKWLGNLVPALFWLTPTAIGVAWVMRTNQVFGPGLWLVLAGLVLGWLGLNYFGLFENGRLRRDSIRNLSLRRPPPPGPVVFVGCASQKHRSLLDAHEDVGFLSMGPDELEFIGDSIRMRLLREQVMEVRFRVNVHTLVGLGRWVSVEGMIAGKHVRMLLEPRERDTMLGNFMLTGWLKKTLEDWREGALPPPVEHESTHAQP